MGCFKSKKEMINNPLERLTDKKVSELNPIILESQKEIIELIPEGKLSLGFEVNSKEEKEFFIDVVLVDSESKISLGTTQTRSGNVIKFEEIFNFEYFFAKNQFLEIKLTSDENINFFKIQVHQLICEKGNVLDLHFGEDLSNKIQVKLNTFEDYSAEYFTNITIFSKLNLKKISPYAVILKNSEINDEKWIKISQSGVEYYNLDEEYEFKIKDLTLSTIKPENNFRIIIFDDLSRNPLIEANFNGSLIHKEENVNLEFKIMDQSLKPSDTELSIKSKIIKSERLFDLLKKGVKIKLNVGIDYSSDNYKSNQAVIDNLITHLNSRIPKNLNQKNSSFYGIGLSENNENSRTFIEFNGVDSNENDKLIDSIRKIDSNLNSNINCNFNDLLRNTLLKISNNKEYNILVILTSTIPQKLDIFEDLIVGASFLSLSVIIVGIGEKIFSEYSTFDLNNENILSDSKGQSAIRANYQFHDFKKFESEEKLVEKIFSVLSCQMIEYYRIFD